MPSSFHREIGGRQLTLRTGDLAGQANGAVLVQYGDTVVLVTACMSPNPREGVDFLPLTVDFEERLYAAGKIPGSFFRREGRPSQEAILAARLTDRPIRPLFPKGFRNEVQVVTTVLSADRENPPDILSVIGASAALSISDIPFEGPIGACRIGYIEGKFVVNPTFSQLEASGLDLVVASTRDAVVMVEAGAREVPEEVALEAIQRGLEVNWTIIDLIEEMVQAVGRPKTPFTPPPPPPEEVVQEVERLLGDRLLPAIFTGGEKGERDAHLDALLQEVVSALGERFPGDQVATAFHSLVNREFRRGVLERGVRPDGRGPRDIRPVSTAVGILPRTHGSGLFTRGQTQVLTIATLGSPGEEQELDTLSPEESKRFIHHYNFPPFSTGEVRRIGSPSRREVGHGALVERALEPVIPDEESFPYTIRLVSEVLSSNGSTSMASVCGSTLALMDAGVPIRAPVAGIAMGLVTGEEGRYAVLTDIQGLEDHIGDMDFKVAGTARGVTAIQLDIKVKGLSLQVLREALEQAREARFFILERLRQTIAEVRPSLSPYAPRMLRLTVPVEKIGAIIGPGGKNIRHIIEETGVTVDVEDDGTVYIGSPNEEALSRARSMIEALIHEVKVGDIYTGKVTRITPFGAFVEIIPGKEGLVRVPELSDRPISRPEDEVKVGDEITVMVTEIDRLGRINLSRRAVFQGLTLPAGERRRSGPPPRPTGGDRRLPPRPAPGGPRSSARPPGPPRPGGARPPGPRPPPPSVRRGPEGGPPGGP